MTTVDTLGIIAGNRSLPLLLAREARATGVKRIVAVGFENETDPALAEHVDTLTWLKVGQLGKMIDALREADARQCVMVGQIAPRNLFDLRPDLRAAKLLFSLKEKNAQTIFAAIASEMEKDGLELVDARPWLRPAMPPAGFALGPKPTTEQTSDIGYGLRLARKVSALEIGQTVVVKNGTVLAVEGLEGTDACLTRGGELAGQKGGAVAVKVAKAGHDMRFDIPCLGPQTLEVCAAAGIAALAFEGERTLLLERDELAGHAERHRVTVVAT